jgi:LmbE family N-acetylglucosaminyl deacetylase
LATEGLSAHKTRKVYVSSWSQSDTYVNISETIDLKIEALRRHESQMRDWDPAPRVKEWAAEVAKGKEMAYAEGFRVITLLSDEDFAKRNGASEG